MLAVTLTFQVPLSGCGDCNSDGSLPTWVIRVRDAATSTPICDAMVFIDTSAIPADGVCWHTAPIPYQQPSATIRVEHPDYQTAEREVPTKWPSDSCGKAKAANLEFALNKL